MVEALLRRHVAERGIDVTVSSAGTTSDGDPASDSTVRVMAELGYDLADHRTRLLTAAMIESSDLVVGMAREHVREVALLVPEAFPRTFTLKEIVRRGAEAGAREPGEPLDRWLARLGDGRTTTSALGSSAEDDVEDPIGRRMAVHERIADQLVTLVADLADLAWPPAPADGDTADDRSPLATTETRH